MLKPLGDHVVSKVEEEKEQTVGGFVLAGTSKERTQVAIAVAVDDGARTLTGELVAPSVAAGDKVIIENGAGIEVKDDDNTITIVREADILAIPAQERLCY